MTADATARTCAGAGDATQTRSASRPGYGGGAGPPLGSGLPPRAQMAAQQGPSRTVVREAIKILSALGRIKAQKGRGLYVADDDGMLGMRWEGFFLPTDLDHVYMLFEFRRVQEIEASRLAAIRARAGQLGGLEA